MEYVTPVIGYVYEAVANLVPQTPTFDVSIFKANLVMAKTRLNILKNEKTFILKRDEPRVADYMRREKNEEVRIITKRLVYDHYMIKAIDLLQIYIDVAIKKRKLVDSSLICSPALSEALTTIIFASNHVPSVELANIRDLLSIKYGQSFVQDAEIDKNKTVSKAVKEYLIPTNTDDYKEKLLRPYLDSIAFQNDIKLRVQFDSIYPNLPVDEFELMNKPSAPLMEDGFLDEPLTDCLDHISDEEQDAPQQDDDVDELTKRMHNLRSTTILFDGIPVTFDNDSSDK
ncbi:hypothetical protein AKO1_010945 [Acrasis kona]|uniref:Uncharacterized protein n=1 Tax=Acrasis kona TaxID=1008807 RepID=A0AAW2YSV3_9EUKA